MLVVSNGTFKSGSTWLFKILFELTGSPPPPVGYLNPDWGNPSLAHDKLASFLAAGLHREQDFLVKNHFDQVELRDLLLADEHTWVMGMKRDERDAVVSAYFHILRKREATNEEIPYTSFADWYFRGGKRQMARIRRYNALWDVHHQRVGIYSYEALSRSEESFAKEVAAMGEKLGITLTEKKINRIRHRTSFEKLTGRSRGEEASGNFYRKGIVGDHPSYFVGDVLEDYLNDLAPPVGSIPT